MTSLSKLNMELVTKFLQGEDVSDYTETLKGAIVQKHTFKPTEEQQQQAEDPQRETAKSESTVASKVAAPAITQEEVESSSGAHSRSTNANEAESEEQSSGAKADREVPAENP